jgi:hypothetical protein
VSSEPMSRKVKFALVALVVMALVYAVVIRD